MCINLWPRPLIQIITVSLRLLSHDPNYNYDSEEEEDAMETDDLLE